MAFFGLFKKEDESSDKNYLKQLLRVAMSDGNVDEKEFEFINKIASKFDVTAEELEEIKSNLQDIKFKEPATSKLRFQMVFDLVWIMLIDEEIDVSEIHICSRIAMKLGYEPQIVENLVNAIQNNLKEGKDPESVYEQILAGIE